MTFLQDVFIVWYEILIRLQIVCAVLECPKIRQDKILSNFENFRCQNSETSKVNDFQQKLKKVVHIVLYGPAISESGCRKQLPYKKSK